MNKFVITATAALLLGSTAVSFADDSGHYVPAEVQIAPVTQQQVNTVRNARAQISNQAVKQVTAEENAWFNRATPQTAN